MLSAGHPPEGISCVENSRMPPIRVKGEAFYVSEEQYSGEFYPSYCASYFMLLSSQSVRTLLSAYKSDISPESVSLFTVYLGLLGKKIGMKVIDGRYDKLTFIGIKVEK